jgi:hypothetical protein
MIKFIAFAKFGWALVIIASVLTNFFIGFEGTFTELLVFMGIFLFLGPYMYYLIKTGLWNQKEERYLLQPIAVIGLIFNFILVVFMLVFSINWSSSETGNSSPGYIMIPFMLPGILIGGYDILQFREAWKYKKFLGSNPFKVETDLTGHPPDLLPYAKATMDSLTVKTRITFKQYLNLMILLTVRNGWIIYIFIVGIVMLAGSIISFSEQAFSLSDFNSIFRLLFGLLVVIIMPTSIYFSAKKNFTSNKRLSEDILYEFSADEIKMTGESFINLRKWTQTYKIEELKHWFLIYESKNIANLVPKDCMTNDEADRFRILVLSIKDPDVKVKVKQG